MNVLGAAVRSFAGILRRLGKCLSRDPSPQPPYSTDRERGEHDRLIRRILSTIHNNSILLCGDRESEKSSILLELRDRLLALGDPGTRFYPIYVDLRDVPEDLLFATIADAVLKQLPFASSSTVDRSCSNYRHRDLVNDLRVVTRTLMNSTANLTRIVLLIDGIDAINDYHPRTAQRVRSLFMTRFNGTLVMVATAVRIDKRWKQEGSPWYNFFEEIELRPIDPKHRGRDRMPENG